MTLSHSVPLFGSHPSSLERALAKCSTRPTISSAVYVLPDNPQVKGFFESFSAHRPCFSSNMKSLIGMESGGSGIARY